MENINWYPGHMAKTKREISENLNLIDVVYEVIDSRMPISSKIIDIDNLIKDKPRIIISTKYDLCDKKVTDELLKVYDNVIKIDLNKDNVKGIISKTKDITKSLNEERKLKGLKARKIRVLVVGVPNVGKSTLINKLVGRKATNVGDMPGVTKNISWIRINDDIELLDSPGILWPKLENQEHAHNLAALSSIKEDILNIEDLAKYVVNKLIMYYPELLKNRYKLDSINEESIYEDIAKKRGMLLKGGIYDLDKVYLTIVKDLKDGKIGNITFDR